MSDQYRCELCHRDTIDPRKYRLPGGEEKRLCYRCWKRHAQPQPTPRIVK